MRNLSPLRHTLWAVMLTVAVGPAPSPAAEPVMYAHYINVGQADATLLEFPCGAILIDAGAQDDSHAEALVAYLDEFFDKRTDLNRTLDSIIITHNHMDHTRALRTVVENFRVLRYIDNGQLEGRGTAHPRWIRQRSSSGVEDIAVRPVSDSEITTIAGITDATIDPVACATCDPVIRILSGRLKDNPDWSNSEFDNKNNHSLVIRVDFGESSFLFTGDLEEPAIETLVLRYENSPMLDVDVYQVGHHGSHNGTTEALVEIMTPEIAMISVGDWRFGRNSNSRSTTYAFGHPRRSVIEMLRTVIHKSRSQAIRAMVATQARHFQQHTVRKKIYATAWDDTVKVRATQEGTFIVTRNN